MEVAMKELIYRLLDDEKPNVELIKEALGKLEKESYDKGYELGFEEGRKKGMLDSIRAINFIKN